MGAYMATTLTPTQHHRTPPHPPLIGRAWRSLKLTPRPIPVRTLVSLKQTPSPPPQPMTPLALKTEKRVTTKSRGLKGVQPEVTLLFFSFKLKIALNTLSSLLYGQLSSKSYPTPVTNFQISYGKKRDFNNKFCFISLLF